MAAPIINFQSISGQQVAAQYQNLPAGSKVVFVNKTSGQVMPSPVTPASGSGTLSMTFSGGSGTYYFAGPGSGRRPSGAKRRVLRDLIECLFAATAPAHHSCVMLVQFRQCSRGFHDHIDPPRQSCSQIRNIDLIGDTIGVADALDIAVLYHLLQSP